MIFAYIQRLSHLFQGYVLVIVGVQVADNRFGQLVARGAVPRHCGGAPGVLVHIA